LLTQIRESHSTRTLRNLETKFEKYDLVICDEFGYISFDKQGAEMLFNHLSLRTGIKSTIITSNLSFEKWNEIFGKDPVLTAALLDRLTHKAYLVNMNGKSYRMKETKQLLQKQKVKAAWTDEKECSDNQKYSWQVALQQSPLPLFSDITKIRLSRIIMQQKKKKINVNA